MFGAHLVLLLWPFCMFARKISKEVGMTDQSIRWYVLNDGQRCFWPKILLHLYTHYTNDLSFFFLSLIFNCIYFYPMYCVVRLPLCMCIMCAQCLQRPEGGIETPGTEVKDGC